MCSFFAFGLLFPNFMLPLLSKCKIPCYTLNLNLHLYCRSTFLYDTLRPKLIHETNIDLLCELVDILKVEVLGEQLSRRSEPLAGLHPTLERILADIHERLTFRARTYIRDEVCVLS